jgi:hypothetical protein
MLSSLCLSSAARTNACRFALNGMNHSCMGMFYCIDISRTII